MDQGPDADRELPLSTRHSALRVLPVKRLSRKADHRATHAGRPPCPVANLLMHLGTHLPWCGAGLQTGASPNELGQSLAVFGSIYTKRRAAGTTDHRTPQEGCD